MHQVVLDQLALQYIAKKISSTALVSQAIVKQVEAPVAEEEVRMHQVVVDQLALQHTANVMTTQAQETDDLISWLIRLCDELQLSSLRFQV